MMARIPAKGRPAPARAHHGDGPSLAGSAAAEPRLYRADFSASITALTAGDAAAPPAKLRQKPG